ncbi:hypothetical protein [Pseudophaeobacter sp. C1-32P7]|uniref:hypothetical protein n=1 Tax=Pseudophaeobacter sp. C1-32P7 TaxID=3098142 RepID=UPI0034D6563B
MQANLYADETGSQITFADGLQTITVGDDLLPLKLVGFDRSTPGQRFLVVFSAALTSRDGKKPPFFSGSTLSAQLGVPGLFFSDPTLAMDDRLRLAFYAGNERVPDLPRHIASVIDAVADHYGLNPILLGGSGGGFASMNVGQHCVCKPSIFVWNPQTKISLYNLKAVNRYVEAAFPTRRSELDGTKEAASRLLNSAGVNESLWSWSGAGRTIYLQNQPDWHTKIHMEPMLQSVSAKPAGPYAFHNQDLDLGFFVGNWGEGHSQPPRAMIAEVIDALLVGKSVPEILEDLSANFDRYKTTVSAEGKSHLTDFSVCAWRNAGSVTAVIVPPENGPNHGLEFAFYLKQGSEVVEKRMYTKSNVIQFNLAVEGATQVTGFVKDRLGNKLSKSVRTVHNS